MDFSLAARLRYYANDNSSSILQQVSTATSQTITSCKQELLCVLDDVVNLEPCCYWNKDVFAETVAGLKRLAAGNTLVIDEGLIELFLTGYHAYSQVTDVINDLSGLNDRPAIKNRAYRIPTYISIVEGCLTNYYHFIALLINQTSEKDYASTYKLKPLCDILSKNGFDRLTISVNINVRNAINHGGLIFKEDGQEIECHYTEKGHSVSCSLKTYEFDQLIDDVYDTASAILLGIAIFMNDNWNLLHISDSQKSYVAFSLLAMKLSIPDIRCRYISEVPSANQLNAEFWVKKTDRQYITELAIELAMLLFSQYDDYKQYYISFSSERLATSWLRFSNQEVSDMIYRRRELSDVLEDAIKKKEVIIFNPSIEPINMQEIKHFRFPSFQNDSYKIRQIEDASLPDRKRLKCHLFIGEKQDKTEILKVITESIAWLKTLRNVDSPTMHHKNGDMEADSIYINVYHNDARKDKGLYPDNRNFVCFVDYNISGNTTLVCGGLPSAIWSRLYHEKTGLLDIAWREAKYIVRRVNKIGANSPCPCGSGKKYKKCCRGKGIYD